jgi:hypothetical protein
VSNDLDRLQRLVTVVVPSHRRLHDAVQTEFEAWCEALSAALAIAAPAFELLHGKIEIADTWTGGTAKDQQGLRRQYAPQRGVRLVDALEQEPQAADRGHFDGSALYWLQDGQLALGDYSGHWSDVPGEENYRTLQLTLLPTAAAWQPVMRAYALDDILDGMADLLERHLKAAPKRLRHADDALARARRLREAARLLKG